MYKQQLVAIGWVNDLFETSPEKYPHLKLEISPKPDKKKEKYPDFQSLNWVKLKNNNTIFKKKINNVSQWTFSTC